MPLNEGKVISSKKQPIAPDSIWTQPDGISMISPVLKPLKQLGSLLLNGERGSIETLNTYNAMLRLVH